MKACIDLPMEAMVKFQKVSCFESLDKTFSEKNLKEFFSLIPKNEWRISDYLLLFKMDITTQDTATYHMKGDWQRWILLGIVIQTIHDCSDLLEKKDTFEMNRYEYQA